MNDQVSVFAAARSLMIVSRVPVVQYFSTRARCACPDPLAGRYDPCPRGCGAQVATLALAPPADEAGVPVPVVAPLPGPAVTVVELSVIEDGPERAPARSCAPMPFAAVAGARLNAHRLTWIEHDESRCHRRAAHVRALARDALGTMLRVAASEPDPAAPRSHAIVSVSPLAGWHASNIDELHAAFESFSELMGLRTG